MFRRFSCSTLVAAILFCATPVLAYEDIRIAEFYTNPCGTQQFIELFVPSGHGDVTGREIRVFDRNGTLTRTLTFTADVPDTENARILIATPDLAAAAQVTTDSAIAALNAGDLDLEGGGIWFGCCGGVQDVDVILYGNYVGPVPPTGTSAVTGGYMNLLPTNGPSVVRLFPQPGFDIAVPTPKNSTGDEGLLPREGDVNADGVVDMVDAGLLTNVLIGNDIDSGRVARSDLDCSGAPDGTDIQHMINLLLPDSNILPDCTGIAEPYVSITYDPLNNFVPFTGPQPINPFFTWGLTTMDTPNVVLAQSESQLWASIDDGCSWFSIGSTDLSGGLYRIEAGPLGFAYAWLDNGTGSGLDAGIYKIHNNPPGSANFDVEFRNAPVSAMHGFGVDKHNPHHVRTAASNGELQESLDGGLSWRRIGVAPSTSTVLAYVNEFDPNDLDHVIYGRVSEGAYVTFDGGKTWTQSDGLKSLPHRGNNFFSATISPIDGNIVYGMGIDLGETGLPGDPPPPPSNGKHIYASTDGGLTFTPVLSSGTGGGEPGEGVFMQNQPLMKSDWENPTKFYYLFGTSCAFGGTRFYGYDLTTGIIETAVADENNGCIPTPRQFEWSRTKPGTLLMGFEFVP
ncbi:MAG: dockerin type I domain-containing protein [Phycisphaerales bacterium]|nr:dockerin type I domain-containing protein [Phycisphaerales bacterium]